MKKGSIVTLGVILGVMSMSNVSLLEAYASENGSGTKLETNQEISNGDKLVDLTNGKVTLDIIDGAKKSEKEIGGNENGVKEDEEYFLPKIVAQEGLNTIGNITGQADKSLVGAKKIHFNGKFRYVTTKEDNSPSYISEEISIYKDVMNGKYWFYETRITDGVTKNYSAEYLKVSSLSKYKMISSDESEIKNEEALSFEEAVDNVDESYSLDGRKNILIIENKYDYLVIDSLASIILDKETKLIKSCILNNTGIIPDKDSTELTWRYNSEVVLPNQIEVKQISLSNSDKPVARVEEPKVGEPRVEEPKVESISKPEDLIQ